MWARHPVSSGSSWPVIVFAVSLLINLRPLRPPQSRKRRVRCAKEPTHKPKLRASEKTHQTEGSWTRLCRDTNSSSWAPPLGKPCEKKCPSNCLCPFPSCFFLVVFLLVFWCSCQDRLAGKHVAAGSAQPARRTIATPGSLAEGGECGQGVSIAAAGLTVFVCHPRAGATDGLHEPHPRRPRRSLWARRLRWPDWTLAETWHRWQTPPML